jgi:hypothetical protein
LVTVHKSEETIQGRKLFVEIWYSIIKKLLFDLIFKNFSF